MLDLGFPPDEAARLLAESGREIRERQAIKDHPMIELSSWIESNKLNPDAASNISRIEAILRHEGSELNTDQLISHRIRVGKKVEVVVT